MKEDRKLQALLQEIQRGALSEEDAARVLELIMASTSNDVYYLSGPMTGHPENNYPAFCRAALLLRSKGLTVINPAENSPCFDPSWVDYMAVSLRQVAQATHVVLLPGWETSHGAQMEYALAAKLNKHLISYSFLVEKLTNATQRNHA